MRRLLPAAGALVAYSISLSVLLAAEPELGKPPLGLKPVPVPTDNPLTKEKVELGKQLYFDPRLSCDETVSCASCHDPKKGWSNGEGVATGVRGQKGGRSAPTIINAAYQSNQFWDGRVRHLEEVLPQQTGEAATPFPAYQLHQFNWQEIIPRLKNGGKYAQALERVFGSPEPTAHAVSQCLATYVRTILSGNSLYDRAKQAAREEGSADLLAKHFEPFLNEAVLIALQRRWPRLWWAPASAVVIAYAVVSTWLAPVVLAPVFNDFEELPPGPARHALLELAAMDMRSKRAAFAEILGVDARTLGIERVSYWSLLGDRAAIECEALFTLAATRFTKKLV